MTRIMRGHARSRRFRYKDEQGKKGIKDWVIILVTIVSAVATGVIAITAWKSFALNSRLISWTLLQEQLNLRPYVAVEYARNPKTGIDECYIKNVGVIPAFGIWPEQKIYVIDSCDIVYGTPFGWGFNYIGAQFGYKGDWTDDENWKLMPFQKRKYEEPNPATPNFINDLTLVYGFRVIFKWTVTYLREIDHRTYQDCDYFEYLAPNPGDLRCPSTGVLKDKVGGRKIIESIDRYESEGTPREIDVVNDFYYIVTDKNRDGTWKTRIKIGQVNIPVWKP
jgi:hypothetical protein